MSKLPLSLFLLVLLAVSSLAFSWPNERGSVTHSVESIQPEIIEREVPEKTPRFRIHYSIQFQAKNPETGQLECWTVEMEKPL